MWRFNQTIASCFEAAPNTKMVFKIPWQKFLIQVSKKKFDRHFFVFWSKPSLTLKKCLLKCFWPINFFPSHKKMDLAKKVAIEPKMKSKSFFSLFSKKKSNRGSFFGRLSLASRKKYQGWKKSVARRYFLETVAHFYLNLFLGGIEFRVPQKGPSKNSFAVAHLVFNARLLEEKPIWLRVFASVAPGNFDASFNLVFWQGSTHRSPVVAKADWANGVHNSI